MIKPEQTVIRGGVAAVYFLNNQSKHLVALMSEIVTTMMILISTMFRSIGYFGEETIFP